MARARRADADRNASAILAAAGQLFAERGPDVPFDVIARQAAVGNATLYRHFPTRSDLLVAVYGDEVAELCRRADPPLGDRSLDDRSPEAALFAWLDEFVVHVVGKRQLALAITETDDGRRTAVFTEWHATINGTATRLLAAAQADGAVRAQITARELLSLLSAAAVAGEDAAGARRLLQIIRIGLHDPDHDAP
jgi:AcrR family transcriptional regulator